MMAAPILVGSSSLLKSSMTPWKLCPARFSRSSLRSSNRRVCSSRLSEPAEDTKEGCHNHCQGRKERWGTTPEPVVVMPELFYLLSKLRFLQCGHCRIRWCCGRGEYVSTGLS